MAGNSPEADSAHWRKTRGVTLLVLLVWVVFAFVVHWYAAPLNQLSFLGMPLGYFLGAQGSLVIFLVLIWFQNWRQDGIDEEYGQDE